MFSLQLDGNTIGLSLSIGCKETRNILIKEIMKNTTKKIKKMSERMIKINLDASFWWHHRYRPSTSLKIIPIILTFYLSIYLHLTTFQLDRLLTHSNYISSIYNSQDCHIQYSQTKIHLYYCLCLCISFISSAFWKHKKQTPFLDQ